VLDQIVEEDTYLAAVCGSDFPAGGSVTVSVPIVLD
jgi:hypothetical protein